MDGRGGLKLFCSYSHRDESLWAELSKHLKLLERQGLVATWYDRQIGAGDLGRQAIDQNLREADIILLLISADFLASDYSESQQQQQIDLSEQRHCSYTR
jgi:hypothetical protein